MKSYFKMPSEIMKFGLNAYEIAVYASLVSHMSPVSSSSWPAIVTISNECGISAKTVRKALHSLAEKGIIKVEEGYSITANGKKKRSANIYSICSAELLKGKNSENGHSSFDADEFFLAALRKSEEDD